MKDAIFEVRGTVYRTAQSFGLYAVSRCVRRLCLCAAMGNAPKPKVLAFVIECGSDFHPLWTKMEPVIDDVCAALFDFCGAVLAPGVA